MNKNFWKEKSIAAKVLMMLLIALNALFVVYWVTLICNYQLHYDDAHFMWKMQEYSIFEYVREMYMTRGGNFVGYGLNGVIFTLSNWVGDYHAWPIIFYVFGIAMVYGAVKDWLKGYTKGEILLGVITLYNVYILTSIDVAVFIWLCAMAYYLHGPAILLLVKYLTTHSLRWWQWIIFGLIVLFLSGSNVAITPMALLIMFVVGMYLWHKAQWDVKQTWANPLVKRIVFTAIAMLCVYGIMVAGPGNYARMDEFDINQPSGIAEFIKACCVCAGMFGYMMVFYLPYHLIAISLGYVVGTKSELSLKMTRSKMVIFVIAVFIIYLGISVMPLAYLSNGFQIQRNYTHICFAYMLMMFALGYVWGYKQTKANIARWFGSVCAIFLIVIMSLNIRQDFPIAKAYNQAHKEREAYLLQLQAEGNRDTVIVTQFPSSHAKDAKCAILDWIGKKSAPQAIYYEADTDLEPNEYESHMKHLLHLDFDFVLSEKKE